MVEAFTGFNVLQSADQIAPEAKPIVRWMQLQFIGKGPPVVCLPHPAPRLRVAVMVDHQRVSVPGAIRVCEDILVDVSFRRNKIMQGKRLGLTEQLPITQQRKEFAFMTLHQRLIRRFIIVSSAILMPITFGQSLNLSVAKHR